MPHKATFRHALETGYHSQRGREDVRAGSSHGDEDIFQPMRFHDTVPPPASFGGSMSAEQSMVTLMTDVHHHLDHDTGVLVHSLNAKHDEVVDQIVRRHDTSMSATKQWVDGVAERLEGAEQEIGLDTVPQPLSSSRNAFAGSSTSSGSASNANVASPGRSDGPDLRDHPAFAMHPGTAVHVVPHRNSPGAAHGPDQAAKQPQYQHGNWYQQATFHPGQQR